jgi:glycosyltransferase involved in cell wall biosynthesis
MRIAIFSDNFYPELSGISDSILTTAQELARRGHQIRFVVPHYGARDFTRVGLVHKELQLDEKISIQRVFAFPVGGPTKQARLIIPTGIPALTLRRFAPDVIHTQLFFGAGIEAIIAARLLKRPLVGTNHTLIEEFARYAPIGKEWFAKKSVAYAIWYYNHCRIVSAPSRFLIEQMQQKGLRAEGLVVPNPTDMTSFTPVSELAKAAAKKHFGFTGTVLVYAGRLAKEKNIDVLIKASAIARQKVPEITLALAGHGAEEKALRALAAKVNMEKRVRFMGTVDKPTLAKMFQAADIFTVASTSETQCMSMMQAMACGLPIVAVRAKALPEYLEHQNGIVVEPNDFQEFASAIVTLARFPVARAQVGEQALKVARAFSPAKIAHIWEKVYDRATKQ